MASKFPKMGKILYGKEWSIIIIVANQNEISIESVKGKPTILDQKSLSDLLQFFLKRKTLDPLYITQPQGIVGANIKEMLEMNKAEAAEYASLGSLVIKAMLNAPFMIYGFFDRFLLGGGLEIALACDVRVITSETQIGFPEVTLGIEPGFKGVELARVRGNSLVNELLFIGMRARGEETNKYSLFHEVIKSDAFAESISLKKQNMLSASPKALSIIKKRIIRTEFGKFEWDALEFGENFEEDWQNEGMRAFLEKRKPEFKE
ncbi:MAG TPA: enoyl-CoA hydratase-related protein [Thermotogota bacterium]|nr:enoyl-CoA hydratase-related protein [Thermotogota bacterium]